MTDDLFFGQTRLVISSPCNTYLIREGGENMASYTLIIFSPGKKSWRNRSDLPLEPLSFISPPLNIV